MRSQFHKLDSKLQALACSRLPLLLLGLGTAAISAASGLDSKLPQPWFATVEAPGPMVYASFVIAAAAMLAPFMRKPANLFFWLVFGFWSAATAVSGAQLYTSGSVTAAVSFLEALTLACASYVVARPTRDIRMLLASLAVMLVTFGAVHLQYHSAISGLLPDGFPLRPLWPFLTGAIMVAAGAMLPFKAPRRLELALVALMFTAWLPLVHAARLIADPSLDEIVFAATAIALIGCLLLAMRTTSNTHPDASAD